jgi:hypothetical protein
MGNESEKLDPASQNVHPAELADAQLLLDCRVVRTRGSGPGGQHRNKVQTAIVITHLPTQIIGQASEKRSQERNREVAVQRLRINLALAIRTKRDAPSDRWSDRVNAGKIRVNPDHRDYPAILAEALDFVHQADLALPITADRLGVSASQLIKLIKTCPAAIEGVNRQRESIGLHPLR